MFPLLPYCYEMSHPAFSSLQQQQFVVLGQNSTGAEAPLFGNVACISLHLAVDLCP